MNIVYSSDDKFIRHIYVSIASLLETNAQNDLHIYIIDNEISRDNKEVLKKLAEGYGKYIEFLPFDKIRNEIEGAALWGNSLSAYGRLFVGRYLDADKALYLDGDSVIVDDLSTLYDIDLSDWALAAVQDTAGPTYRMGVGLSYDEKYINTGMILINLKKWREDNLEKKFIDFIKKYNGQVPCCDQGTINGVCRGKILIIAPKYNLMTPMLTFKSDEIKRFFEISEYYTDNELIDAREHSVFIHYVGGFYIQPWFINGDHPKSEIYRKYMEKSPWKGDYFPAKDLGMRTKLLKMAYYHLPFSVFVFLHRSVRNIKRVGLRT